METQFQSCCKVAAAALILLLLTTAAVDGQVQEAVIGGAECSVGDRSSTFKGDCTGSSKTACVDACRNESYVEGHCFVDVADPDHPVCICTKPCPPSSV